jgi:prepilin-type N-terminal cleavage/methylation domain-containing protein
MRLKPPTISPHAPWRRGFTIMELMLVILIISIVSLLSIDTVADFEANQRADRAARESLAFFRYARSLAMTTGKKAEVVVSPAAGTLSVFWQSNGTSWDATPVATGATASGQWVLNLNNQRELVGTAVSLNPSGTTSFVYGALGTCVQTGTLTFTFAGRTKSLVVANVGDPKIQ